MDEEERPHAMQPGPTIEGEHAADTVIPLQPRSGQPITDGSGALVALRDRAMAAERGFATMVRKAQPEFRAVADGYRAMHEGHAVVLGKILTNRGLPLDGAGSFLGNVNEAVVTVRAFFDGTDADVLAQVRDGEKFVLWAFDHALAAPLPGTEAETIRRLRTELSGLLAQTCAPH